MKPNLLKALLVLCLGCGHAAAQSKDRDHPTPVVTPEITGFIDKTVGGDRYFYGFSAGPGELTLTLDVTAGKGMLTFATINMDLFYADGRSAGASILCNPSDGEDCRRTLRVTLARKQPLVLRISIDAQSSAGKYRVSLVGPVDFARNNSAAGSQGGRMRIEFVDGTTQEIEMGRIRRVTIDK